MFRKIKSMFKKEPINTITTKEVDDFYVEHTITKSVNVAGKDVIEVEKVIQTKPEIIERAIKAINDQNKEELGKALAKPFKGIPDQEPKLILATAKMNDTDYFDLVIGAIEQPDTKQEPIFGLIAVHGSIAVLQHWLNTRQPTPNSVLTIISDLFANDRQDVLDLLFDTYKIRFSNFEKAFISEQANSKRKRMIDSIQTNNTLSDEDKEQQLKKIFTNKGMDAHLIQDTIEKYQNNDVRKNTGRPSAIDKRKEYSTKPDYLKL